MCPGASNSAWPPRPSWPPRGPALLAPPPVGYIAHRQGTCRAAGRFVRFVSLTGHLVQRDTGRGSCRTDHDFQLFRSRTPTYMGIFASWSSCLHRVYRYFRVGSTAVGVTCAPHPVTNLSFFWQITNSSFSRSPKLRVILLLLAPFCFVSVRFAGQLDFSLLWWNVRHPHPSSTQEGGFVFL